MSKLSKKTMLLIGGGVVTLVVIIAGILLVTNGGSSDADNNTENNTLSTGHQACYDQCEEWGGEVSICKENCDASFDTDSIWNQSDEDVIADNDDTFNSWEGMPLAVPEFMYGDFVSGIEGMSSWIVDFENVTDEDALEDYVSDLEIYDWSASYMSVTHMLTGSKDGYTISASMDPDYGTVQIIVRETN